MFLMDESKNGGSTVDAVGFRLSLSLVRLGPSQHTVTSVSLSCSLARRPLASLCPASLCLPSLFPSPLAQHRARLALTLSLAPNNDIYTTTTVLPRHRF
jgi:hypothetical protein